MAYQKTIWKNREVEKPRTFTMQNNPDGTITLIPAEGQIVEAGTPIIAVNMNNIEDGIEAAHNSIEAHSASNTAHITGTERTSWNGKIDKSLATAANDFLVASGKGTWVKKTLAEVRTLLSCLLTTGGIMSGEINHADNLVTRPYLKDYAEAVAANAAATGTVTLNIETANNFNLTISGATTLVFSNPSVSGRACSITVIIRMPATLYAVTFPSSVKWEDDKIPEFNASKTAVLTFVTVNGGSRWYGMSAGTKFTT